MHHCLTFLSTTVKDLKPSGLLVNAVVCTYICDVWRFPQKSLCPWGNLRHGTEVNWHFSTCHRCVQDANPLIIQLSSWYGLSSISGVLWRAQTFHSPLCIRTPQLCTQRAGADVGLSMQVQAQLFLHWQQWHKCSYYWAVLFHIQTFFLWSRWKCWTGEYTSGAA